MKSIRLFPLSPNEFGHLCKVDFLQESFHMDPRDVMAPAICPGAGLFVGMSNNSSQAPNDGPQLGVHTQDSHSETPR